ncbi:kelch repeat and BTB domain-containing protein 13 [Eucyclogobius newberryi]|uniref:kelch repeat and BTB domain-containing protein 13 n=1 Tax=Eucyclogobius newberryi TaxID=166745 RepID=UPI003B5C4AC2
MRIYCDEVMESGCPARQPGQRKLRVRVHGHCFVVNKDLLAQNCEYFRALFQSGMKECQEDEICLRCVGLLGFQVMMQVLEGGRPMLNCDQIVEAIECAAFLQVPSLTKHLINVINSENCLLMFHTASTFGVWDLFHNSALFIQDIYSDLKDDLCTLPKTLTDYVEALIPASYMAVCSHSPSSDELENFQRTVSYLDEELKEWKALTQLPSSASTTMAGVAVLDNKLYIVGGVHDVSKNIVQSGFCYNPLTNSWSTICRPNQLRYNLTLVGHDGCLYALGGECDHKELSSVERYRVANGHWSYVSQLPRQSASVVSAVALDRIFICLWKGRGASDIFEYSPEKDQWILETTLVRDQSYGLCMVPHKDNLYLMRNGPCNDFLLCVMDCYNVSSRQWTAMPGQYVNSKGSLFTAAVKGDSVFTLSRKVTTEYTIEDYKWKRKREMTGFGRIGSIYTFLMRLPKTTLPLAERSAASAPGQRSGNIDGHRRHLVRCVDNL